MKQRVNGKAVLILLGSAVALTVSVYFVHGYQMKRNARGLFEQALLVEQEGQLARAAEYLDEYLGMAPDDHEARNDAQARLGLILEQLAKTPRARAQAFFVLSQALRRDGQRKDVRRRVARLAQSLGQYAKAAQQLDVLLKDLPDDAELLQLMGRSLAAESKYVEALERYNKALKHAPGQVDLCMERAMLLRERLKLPDLADSQIEAMVRGN